MSLVTRYRDWHMKEDPVGYNAEEIWDHATVESVFYPELARWYDEENAEWLKKDLSLKVQLEGHCDERGTNNYNLEPQFV